MGGQSTGQISRLWPVIPANDRRAFSSAIWRVFNLWAIVLIALPYCVVAACCSVGWVAISGAHTYSLAHFGFGRATWWLAVGMRCVLLGLTVRLEWVMLGMLPWIIREARDCFEEALNV